jgi:Xaa-Pro aminopeptidase
MTDSVIDSRDLRATLAARRARAAAALAARASEPRDAVVLIAAGLPVHRPGKADQTYPYIPHSDYFWLTDHARPGSVLAFDGGEGFAHFVPPVTQAERYWEGAGSHGERDERTAGATDLGTLASWLDARRGRPVAVLGSAAALPNLAADAALSERLAGRLLHARREKDALELSRMRRAIAATAAGFAAARGWLRPGVTERRVQIEMEAAFFRAGADATGYDSIVGSGPNSAVLHFAPSARELRAGEPVLIDAGGAVEGYVADVTRTFPVAGADFSSELRDLYQAVLSAEERAIAKCRAGVEYRDIHLGAAVDLARGLVDMGILRGEPETLVERHAQALFFPHGAGHMVGLGVRDAGGYLEGRVKRDDPTSRYLRIDLPLRAGYTVTIEPGLYFIPALLEDPEHRARYRDAVDWARVDRMKHLGGVRIEDNVLVTEGEPEVLTAAIEKRLA